MFCWSISGTYPIAFIVVIPFGSEFTMLPRKSVPLKELLRLQKLGPTRLGSGGMAITRLIVFFPMMSP